jgi:hypothetical protein
MKTVTATTDASSRDQGATVWRSSMTTVRNSGEDLSVPQPSSAARSEPPGKPILEYVTTIGGFTAVLSALLLFFGYESTVVLFEYFGVPAGVLNFSTTDYLLCSPEVIFQPAIWAMAGLALLCGLIYALRWMKSTKRRGWQTFLRVAFPAIPVILTASAVAVVPASFFGRASGCSAALLLALSAAALIFQYDVARQNKPHNPPVGILALGIGLMIGASFWLEYLHAHDSGVEEAKCIAQGICPLPDAVIHTKESLPLPGGSQQPGERRPPWGYVFSGGDDKRLSSFKVLAYANHRWFLLSFFCESNPKDCKWDPKKQTFILPDDDKNVLVTVANPAPPEH